MGAKRDFVGEIQEVRGRTGPAEWDNGITKLLFLCTQMQTLQKESEQNAYFLVACVAAIETYFRWEIRRLIDSADAQYINNFRLEDSPLKISHDLLVAIHGKRVTIGELIAHSARLSNLDAINKIMSQLLGTDFLDLVKDAREPESRREGGDAPTVIRSLGDTLTRLRRAFELRHIICHEAHLMTPVRLDEVRELCSSCYEFVCASNYGIKYHENPNAPLTLEDAYEAARERVRVLEIQIKAIEELITSKVDPLMHQAFDAMQSAWKLYVEREADFNASPHMNGNRGALYEQLAIESLYKKRLDKMKEYAGKVGSSGTGS
jgi:hypothetical protein